MIKEFIGTGKTVEEATQNAKLQLNAPEMADVHVEVIKYPEKKKFFGLIGGCDAEVKVSYDDGKREKKADAPKKSYEKSGLKETGRSFAYAVCFSAFFRSGSCARIRSVSN